jgi:hypothetical protein
MFNFYHYKYITDVEWARCDFGAAIERLFDEMRDK